MSLDFSSPDPYTEATQSKMIEQAAFAGTQRALASFFGASQLENSTDWMNELPQRREENMASKQQFKITLPSGERVWACGDTVSEAFINFAKTYGVLFAGADNEYPQKDVQTLQQFVDETYRPSFIAGLKPTTQASYEHYLKKCILPFMGHMPLNQIALTTIQQFYDHMAHAAQHGYQKNYNEATIKRIRGLLSRIFAVAQEMGIIQDTPIKNRLLQIKAEQSGHHKALPDALISEVKQKIPTLEDPELRLYFALLAYTGMRREEILGLHWEDVDLGTGTAYVRWTVTYPKQNRPFVQNSAKSKYAIRPVLLATPVLQIMKPLAKPKGFLFGDDVPWCYSTFVRHFRKGKKLLGFEGYTSHDFRTTLGTQLKENGATSAQVADVLGHADTRMVETVYARTREEGIQKRRADIEKLNTIFTIAQR